jgi:Carboxypeptidase regulatory-like domain
MRYRVLVVGFGLLLLGRGAAYAQTEAAIVGVVTDETKAVLPGVTITAIDLATARQLTALTDVRGEYRLPSMPPGRYKLQAELQGFATMVVPEVELLVGQK